MAGCLFKLGCGQNASVFRIEGDAMMRDSPAAKTAMLKVLQTPDTTLFVDLNGCEYLDSTWLGSLLDLFIQHGRTGRFVLAADLDRRAKLFGSTRLDRVIKFVDVAPPIQGDWFVITPGQVNAGELAQHVLDCHVKLSQADTPQKKQFESIAQQLQRELESVK